MCGARLSRMELDALSRLIEVEPEGLRAKAGERLDAQALGQLGLAQRELRELYAKLSARPAVPDFELDLSKASTPEVFRRALRQGGAEGRQTAARVAPRASTRSTARSKLSGDFEPRPAGADDARLQHDRRASGARERASSRDQAQRHPGRAGDLEVLGDHQIAEQRPIAATLPEPARRGGAAEDVREPAGPTLERR